MEVPCAPKKNYNERPKIIVNDPKIIKKLDFNNIKK